MKRIVFYSWQSDLPNSTNRGFIEKALETVAKVVRNDDTIAVEPVVERDVTGEAGAPDIPSTILARIEKADVFVADVSIINQGQSRPTPNPNVLVELGYAMKALGPTHIVLVFNNAFGKPEDLPFDLRMRLVTTYNEPEENKGRSAERQVLQNKLESALRAIFQNLPMPADSKPIKPEPLTAQTVTAINASRADQAAEVRRFMSGLLDELERIAPDFSKGDRHDELLLEALGKTTGIVCDFAKVAEAIALMNSATAAMALHKSFERLLEHYHLRSGGAFRDSDFDFFKFMGHELFVTFISFLIREGRWEVISDVLEKGIYVENPHGGNNPSLVDYTYISEYLALLDHWNQKQKQRWISPQGHVLNERHSSGEISKCSPIEAFAAADFFLFLRSVFQHPDSEWIMWRPWSALYLKKPPRFIVESASKSHLQQILRPLGITDAEIFLKTLGSRSSLLQKLFPSWPWRHPLSGFDFNSIGKRP